MSFIFTLTDPWNREYNIKISNGSGGQALPQYVGVSRQGRCPVTQPTGIFIKLIDRKVVFFI